MLFIWLGLLAILVLAGLITLYAAYPHRGEDVPFVGRARAADHQIHRVMLP